jgi:hypothetical protein
MTVKLKKFFKICNFVLSFLIVSNIANAADAGTQEAINLDTCNIRFTPRCLPIGPIEFNPVARAIYEDCTKGVSIGGKTALETFKSTYTDFTSLGKEVREYIQNIHLAHATIYKFLEDLNIIEAKTGVERLKPLIQGRRQLILAVSHCAFDFNTEDLYKMHRFASSLYRAICSKSMVTEATVDRSGVILTINGMPTLVADNTCRDHPDFGKLCAITKTFTDDFLKTKPVIDRLLATGRLTHIAPKTEDKKENADKEDKKEKDRDA